MTARYTVLVQTETVYWEKVYDGTSRVKFFSAIRTWGNTKGAKVRVICPIHDYPFTEYSNVEVSEYYMR